LDAYLAERCDTPHNGDVLDWWHRRADVYPRLSRMAMDYLTIPGESVVFARLYARLTQSFAATSVDVERVFSRGRDLLSYRRNRLSGARLRALLLLGDWHRTGVIGYNDIFQALKLADQRSKGPAAAAAAAPVPLFLPGSPLSSTSGSRSTSPTRPAAAAIFAL
jgi:hypothetical protein